jgi:uncharacterized membrane protein YuzA (DUF378 family)
MESIFYGVIGLVAVLLTALIFTYFEKRSRQKKKS